MVENITGNGENAGYQHFLLFPQSTEKASFSWTVCEVKVSTQGRLISMETFYCLYIVCMTRDQFSS